MIEVNLLPDVKLELVRMQAQRSFVISVSIIVTIVATVIVASLASYTYVAQGLILSSSTSKIDKEYQKLSSVEDIDKILTVKNQLSSLSSLNDNKYVMSRAYDMLNAIVPGDGHDMKLAVVSVSPPEEQAADQGVPGDESQEAGAGFESPGAITITIEGQAAGGFASFEVFEKMLGAAVFQYIPRQGVTDMDGDLNCGDNRYQCRRLVATDGLGKPIINVSDTSFGEDHNGRKALYFKLSFSTASELFSNKVQDVGIKIGQNGNVTDSYLGVPRAIFESRPVTDGEKDE